MAILVADRSLKFSTAKTFYQRVQRKDLSEPQLNSVLEQLLFSLNQIAALQGLATVPNKADVARVGIVTWYYELYGAASAMIAAADGSFPETHATTAPQWDRQFAAPKLAMEPFNDRLSSLVSSDVDEEMATPRSRGRHSLTSVPTTVDQAWGCHAEYLSGTASWEQWNLELRVRRSPEFRALAVDNFRTKAARALRDDAFGKRSVAFLHEASRYRGKARGWFEALTLGESFAEIAEREGVWKQRIQQMLPLAFLAPDIVQMIAEGRQPVALTCEALINADLPIDWADQRALIACL